MSAPPGEDACLVGASSTVTSMRARPHPVSDGDGLFIAPEGFRLRLARLFRQPDGSPRSTCGPRPAGAPEPRRPPPRAPRSASRSAAVGSRPGTTCGADEMRVEASQPRIRDGEHVEEDGDVRPRPCTRVAASRARAVRVPPTASGACASTLREHRVVVDAHLRPVSTPLSNECPARGLPPHDERAVAEEVRARVLGVDPCLDRVPTDDDVLLAKRQRARLRARSVFGTSVEAVTSSVTGCSPGGACSPRGSKIARRVDHELDRAGIVVRDRCPGGDRGGAHALAARVVDRRRRRLSRIFWCARCTEHSRSKQWRSVPWVSTEDLNLHGRGGRDVALDESVSSPKRSSASRRAASSATRWPAASCTSRIPVRPARRVLHEQR